jgi:DNA/RNA-binding domain of Phe-tRNA-synthetase-like protein
VFEVSEVWETTYPGAAVGVLAMRGAANPREHTGLEQRKQALEEELRARFAGYDRAALRALPILQAYHDYYKGFRKTYHVQLQLESIVLKGQSIPRVAALVEAMFMAELKNQLLTAGHDLDVVHLPARVEVADGSERFVRINGQEQKLKPGDMYIADGEGVLSSVIYGPDRRTQIRPQTSRVLFTTYAPQGLPWSAVEGHLKDLRANVQVIAPDAEVEQMRVYGAAPR